MKIINGLKNIIDSFDTFILDQWGVLHNGGDAFEQAVETLEFLQKHNKKVVILSNSGNTHHFSYARLQDSGIRRDLYIDVLTSGDHMRHNFNSGKFKHLGTKPLFFTWEESTTVLEECGLTSTPVEDASFVLCYGISRPGVADYMDDLKAARARNLELVVSNPDLVAMTPEGSLKMCPGSIAKAYQDMGGIVHWHGKPQPDIYAMCRELVGGWENAIAVGDSMEHDMAGADNAGISSLFITSGIHAQEITDQQSINDLSAKYAVNPSFYINWFKV
ncbi:TIGR01459 family HAD-type hydrolase [Psychromonas ossibalaenae]|uniref:TIGR01459 family HAD-type hydrolase n=1 Tax=Psychromonas ossibalaenae TaxID=444922 RepID=UPI0003728E6F|nr:TIGR01459 family HAD-type hydrolase [Psychromonas ossibalaenae]